MMTAQYTQTLDRDTRIWPAVARLDLLLSINLSAFVLSTVYYYCVTAYGGASWPYSSPLWDPRFGFKDFFDMLRATHDLSGAAGQSLYLPAANVYFHVFGQLPADAALLVFFGSALGIVVTCAAACLRSFGYVRLVTYTVGIVLLSHPLLFALDRANLDLHVFAFLAAFFLLVRKTDRLSKFGAVLCLALPIAFKAYPVLFALLYLKERRYREFIYVGLLALGLTLAGAMLQGGIWHSMSAFLGNAQQTTSLPTAVIARFSVSLYGAGRIFLDLFEADRLRDTFDMSYRYLAAVLLVTSCGVVLRRRYSMWQASTVLACAICLLPTLSNDYRLLMVLLPLSWFVASDESASTSNKAICVTFGLLLVPKGHLVVDYTPHLGGPWGDGVLTSASLLNPVLLLTLAMFVLSSSNEQQNIRSTEPSENPVH